MYSPFSSYIYNGSKILKNLLAPFIPFIKISDASVFLFEYTVLISFGEDLFILPEWQGHGFGSEAIHQLEEIVKQYSVSIYIEAAARNEAAIQLYRKLGYDCLNTVTIRKDFPGYDYDVVRKENIHGMEFEIRKDKNF